MVSDTKHKEMLVDVLQELIIQDAGSSSPSILTGMFVHFPINLNSTAQPPPNKSSPEKCPQTTALSSGFLAVFCIIFCFSLNESDS